MQKVQPSELTKRPALIVHAPFPESTAAPELQKKASEEAHALGQLVTEVHTTNLVSEIVHELRELNPRKVVLRHFKRDSPARRRPPLKSNVNLGKLELP